MLCPPLESGGGSLELVEPLLTAGSAGHGTAARGGPVSRAAGQTRHTPPPPVTRPHLPPRGRLACSAGPEPGTGHLGRVQRTDPGIGGRVTPGQDRTRLDYHALTLPSSPAGDPPAHRQLLLDRGHIIMGWISTSTQCYT